MQKLNQNNAEVRFSNGVYHVFNNETYNVVAYAGTSVEAYTILGNLLNF